MRPLRYMLVFLMLMCAVNLNAREASDFFLDIPNKHLPLLDRNTRLDMVDYFKAGLMTGTKTGLGGEARILTEHPRRMLVSVSRDATVEIALVKAGSDTLVALIETVKTPIPDSFITIMNKDFSNPRVIPMPDARMFAEPTKAKVVSASSEPLMMFVSAGFDPDNNAFIFTNNTLEYYPSAEVPEVAKMLRSQIHGVLKGDKFVELKK